MTTILLLTLSNVLMTFAWYWHLKGGVAAGIAAGRPMLAIILISWGIAFFEYALAVPANRIGAASGWTVGELKVAQEAIALTVFGVFMVTFLGEPMHWRYLAAFACILAAAGFLFLGR
jgi:uncharacterized protein